MYYLNSRFYDPAIGRFINADTIELVLASQCTLSDKNLYAYCDNNPVMRRDESGAAWETVFDLISLGASITDVVANPANAWAWIGLAGDIADVAIPFIGGIGETIKCCGAVNKADNIIDVAKKSGSKPNQIHHFATNKSKKYTSQFENITQKYGLDLDGDWNKELMPHQGANSDKTARSFRF